MVKEFMQLYEAMKKVADLLATSTDNQVEEDRCLNAFKLLKKFPVNYEILISTQVGNKHLRGLTKHPIKKVRDFAMRLVETWKAIVIKGVSKNKKEKVDHKPSNKTISAENFKDSKMEKELIQLYEAVKKAADLVATSTNNQVEEDRCLDAFKLLKKFPVNYEILVSTQVGKHLRGLTKHPREKIRAFVTDLVETWKAIIINGIGKNKKEKVDQKPSNKAISTENVKVENVQKTHHVIRLKTPKVVADVVKVEKTDENIETSTPEKVKEKDSNIGSDKTVSEANITKDQKKQVSEIPKKASSSPVSLSKQKTMIKSFDVTRDKIREMLQEAFSRVSKEANEAIMDQVKACDPIKVSVAVESVLFQKWRYFNGAQKIKYRSLMFNLKDPKNLDFRRRVALGEFTLEQLVNIRTEDMASDERKKELENIKMKALMECGRGQKPKATTNQFMCGKCGKRECTYHQLQTCSADEPMTIYVNCVLCNHHWKFC